ncbi:MAG: ABC transporter permease [Phycisphaerae bacterium]|nr:ABC transporter permease [Phycisphaerae bacterium]MCZ2398320.1 ABC transporter permease [Phycisphaerae bacterium]
MAPGRIVWRSLTHYWRTNLATALGVAVGAAALTGALLVGDSMRGSLRDMALRRLGRVECGVLATRFVPENLVERVEAACAGRARAVPLIWMTGSASNPESGALAHQVQVYGVEQRFELTRESTDDVPRPASLDVVLSAALAEELSARLGDDVLIRVPQPADVARESLMGRRDLATTGLRLTVRGISPRRSAGGFGLTPSAQAPRSAFVELAALQRALGQRGRVNTVLVTGVGAGEPRRVEAREVESALGKLLTARDAGLRLREDEQVGYLALESDAILIDEGVEEAARQSATRLGLQADGVLVHLANRIETVGDAPAGIPYSTVAGIERPEELRLLDGAQASGLADGEILLNEWAARELRAGKGQRVRLVYYAMGEQGRLLTRAAEFTVAGVVALAGVAADPGLAPAYPGVTDAARMSDWNPPFPIDLGAIRPQDEAYWDAHRATPKAFVRLDEAQRLWADRPERYGRLTSLRLVSAAPSRHSLALADAFERELMDRLGAAAIGLGVQPLRDQALAASRGSTDFGGLFIGFSLFLIVSSAMLVALLFRLGVERRSAQLGVLLSTGHTRRCVTRMLMQEGLSVSAIGAAIGLPAAALYAAAMLHGLRTWWSAAVGAPEIMLHLSWRTFVVGYAATLAVSAIAIWLATRRIAATPPAALLAGATGTPEAREQRGPGARTPTLAWVTTVAAASVAAIGAFGGISQAAGFFGGGALMVVAGLAWLRVGLDCRGRRAIDRPTAWAVLRLGMRNVRRQAGRSMLTAGLMGSATFLIVALSAFQIDAGRGAGDIRGSSGGFSLIAESAAPLLFDLNTADGREALGIAEDTRAALDRARVYALRLRGGDEASCLNLYQPREPRIAGATSALIERGGFAMAAVSRRWGPAGDNPWRLLNAELPGGEIPVIGDEAAVRWQLKRGLDEVLVVRNERGAEVGLRFVALLSGSLLQSELVISEAHFTRLFPSVEGYRLFLVQADSRAAERLPALLERDLAAHGFDVTPAGERLRAFSVVQNTYLSAFQALGGLGLVLGTVGLAAVLLRGVWERRGELALLRALGYSRRALGAMIMAENLLLVSVGLALGALPALAAILPVLAGRGGAVPWATIALTIAGVFAAAAVSGAVALRPVLRAPLLGALRAE